jgi:small subunit ribosomal protein S15e
MLILPEMQGAQIGCHNGRGFLLVEVKPGMIGNYLGEHSITYKPVKHGHVSKNFHSRFMVMV